MSKYLLVQATKNSLVILGSDSSKNGIILREYEKHEFDVDTDRFVGIDPESVYASGSGILLVAVLVEE